MTLADIAEQWVQRLVLHEIQYDPRRVATRWVVAPAGHDQRFKVLWNGNRKARLEKVAS